MLGGGNPVDKRVGSRVQELRIAAGLTVEELARRIGADALLINEIENGVRRAHPAVLVALASEFCVPIYAWFDDRDIYERAASLRRMRKFDS